MNVITVRILGGLGNQLHCYAFGRALAAQNSVPLVLDADSGFWDEAYRREYLLHHFSGLSAQRREFPPDTTAARLFFKVLIKLGGIVSRFLPLPLKPVILEGIPRRYQPELHRTRYLVSPYFLGYWASYLYYQDIEHQLRLELKPPVPAQPEALAVLTRIKAAKSCFIHWRSYNEEKTMNRHDLSGYYLRAVRFMAERYPGIAFFVFSDDPAGARKALGEAGKNAVFVDLPAASGNAQGLVDFYLMYTCDHAIIGHSTFSWWAAWLGDSDAKTVVFPKGVSPWVDDWPPPKWHGFELDGGDRN